MLLFGAAVGFFWEVENNDVPNAHLLTSSLILQGGFIPVEIVEENVFGYIHPNYPNSQYVFKWSEQGDDSLFGYLSSGVASDSLSLYSDNENCSIFFDHSSSTHDRSTFYFWLSQVNVLAITSRDKEVFTEDETHLICESVIPKSMYRALSLR